MCVSCRQQWHKPQGSRGTTTEQQLLTLRCTELRFGGRGYRDEVDNGPFTAGTRAFTRSANNETFVFTAFRLWSHSLQSAIIITGAEGFQWTDGRFKGETNQKSAPEERNDFSRTVVRCHLEPVWPFSSNLWHHVLPESCCSPDLFSSFPHHSL